jgi:hypothetical protein
MVGGLFGTQESKNMKKVMEEAEQILAFVGLKEKVEERVSNLTIPNRKRLEVARALAMRPKLLLLDEIQGRIRELMIAPLVRGPQDLAISGSKVMDVTGLSPGPEVGRILARLSEELMDHPEWNTRKRLMALLKEMKPAALTDHSEVFGEVHRTAGRLKTRAQPKS